MAPDSENNGQSAAPEAREVDLTPLEREDLVTKKATCPFLGSAIATGQLAVRHRPGNLLASVQEVIELGNTGGGDLGQVLGFFARGNHGKMRGPAGNELDTPVPDGLFSLELPGSQGSHAGHSGILQDDPEQLDSGRFSASDFQRLAALGRNGFIKRSDIARFIAENLRRDPRSKSFPVATWASETADLFGKPDETEIQQSLARIAGSNNLLGSAGEFGLLLAFLHNSPRTRQDAKDPAFSMDEIAAMFREHDKKLPDDWRSWKKTAKDLVLHTAALARGAIAELIRMGFMKALPRKLLARLGP